MKVVCIIYYNYTRAKEAFADFLQRLTSAVNRIIWDSEVRKKTEALTFENANSECKGVVRYLKAILEQIEEWFRHRTDIGSHVHGANFKEAISKRIKKNLNGRWVNCGKQGHLKWILGKALLEPFFS